MSSTSQLQEVWLPVPSLAGKYEASSGGRVRSVSTGHVLTAKPHPGSTYLSVAIWLPTGSRKRRVHLLVAEAFHGPRPAGNEVNHKDGNKANCCPDNLEYLTHQKNMDHAVEMGLVAHGERAAGKLTEVQAREIFRLSAVGMTRRHVAAMFGVTHRVVRQIALGRSWRRLGLVSNPANGRSAAEPARGAVV